MQRITRKSLLYQSGVEYADYCINHVEGCSHGCKYPCYAMMMKKRCGVIKDYKDWIKPKIVVNALELLDKEIPKLKDKIRVVHLCFTTDPFMYKQKQISDLTLKIIERLNQDNIRCTVLTKGVYPRELIDTKKYGENNEYAITLVSLDNKFKNNFEPGSAPYKSRIKSLRYLHDNGLNTWVSMEPYPTPNLSPKQNLSEILKEVSFVDKIIFGKFNYNVDVSQSVYKESKKFYELCAEQVISFSKKYGIDYHIKNGTRKKDSKKTVKIFKSYPTINKVGSLEQVKLNI
ncbi:radical SAM protein [Patescibacteria group bacterium]|nr:radical SAM protein [Patescibacteria group bacterium]